MADLTKISLSDAVILKNRIQDKLTRNQQILREENTLPKKQKRNFNLTKILAESETLRDQMVTLKLLIQEANLVIAEGEKHPISYYVYWLSEKKREQDNLKALKCLEGPQPMSLLNYKTPKSQDVLVDCSCHISSSTREEMLSKVSKEYYDILEKLTKLNNTIRITLPFNSKNL